MTEIDAAGPVRTFGWNAAPFDRHTQRVAGIGVALLAAGLVMLIAERSDLLLVGFAGLLVLVGAGVLFELVWLRLTIRSPVVEIGPDGVIDRRIVSAPVRWSDVDTIYGGLGPDVEIKVRPSRWHRVQKRGLRDLWMRYGLGSGSFMIVAAPLDMGGADLHALCRGHHKAAKRARAAAVVPALERVAREGLQGAALDTLAAAIRDVPMLIPIFEEHHAQRLDVVEEAGGTRAMHVFTDKERYYTNPPQDYYSPMYPDEVFGVVAASYELGAIVMNPGVGPELRIKRERFGEIAALLRGSA